MLHFTLQAFAVASRRSPEMLGIRVQNDSSINTPFRTLNSPEPIQKTKKRNGTVGWARTTDLRIHNPAL